MIMVTLALGLCFAVFLFWFFSSIVDQFFEEDIVVCYRSYRRPAACRNGSEISKCHTHAAHYTSGNPRPAASKTHPKSA
ncbi:MAG TPA: hypothetical protein GXZ67_07300 [Clostridiaceae bacterium]|jgi:hypothetical protein|nr:hypothetical protein [Clostridiaceae bacterium]